METTQRPESIIELFRRYIAVTVVDTLKIASLMTLLTLGVFYNLATDSPERLMFAVLAVVGWSLYLSQESAVQSIHPEEDTAGGSSSEGENNGLVDEALDLLFTVGAGVYFTFATAVAVGLGSAMAASGNSFLAIVLPLVYPAWETATADRNIPLSIAGFAAFTYMLTHRVAETAQEASWSELGIGRFPIEFWNRRRRQYAR